MTDKLNTKYTFEFYDGTSTELSLRFIDLYKLKAKNRGMYDKYHKCMSNQANNKVDELEMVTILYVAYFCAHMDDPEIMTEEEFIMKCGCDRVAVANAIKILTQPKKQ